MNRALYVGHAPGLLVKLLDTYRAGLSKHFTVVGAHALYAYESAGGVRFSVAAVANRDFDPLWDTRRGIRLVTQMEALGSSMIGLIRKVDPTFELVQGERCTAINSKGFGIDTIRREAREGDSPLSPTAGEDGFGAVQAPQADLPLSGPRFSPMIVSSSGWQAALC